MSARISTDPSAPPPRNPARLVRAVARMSVGVVVVIPLVVLGGCTADAGADSSSASSAAAGDSATVDFTVKSLVAELSPQVAAIVDRPLVTPEVEVNADAPEVAGGLAAVAVSDGIDYTSGTATSYRIVVDPDALADIGPAATRALLAHELVHLYLQPVTATTTPLWLVEGIADVVGYRAAGTDLDDVRDGVLKQFASVPAALPSDDDFSSDDDSVRDTAYGVAWSVVEYLTEQLGIDDTIAMYRTVAGSSTPQGTLQAQLIERLGYGYDELVIHWQASVEADL